LVVWGKLWVFPDILFDELNLPCDVGELVKRGLDKTKMVYFFL
jgi:hypothetical protein